MGADSGELQGLGAYLRDRRQRLDPAELGYASGRRRTPGLRREEVAQRAGISPTWYTWLEQGRGGPPSADALTRIADALMLTEVEREHLFLLALGRPPDRRYRPTAGISGRLQRVLDALEPTPALIRNALWDVVGWNHAATVFLFDFDEAGPGERNLMRRIFLDPRVRGAQYDWETVARHVVSAFRIETARAGAADEVRPLIEELSAASAEFRHMWASGDVMNMHGEAVKRLRHPVLGDLAFEHSAFTVEGRPDLALIVYNPVSPDPRGAETMNRGGQEEEWCRLGDSNT